MCLYPKLIPNKRYLPTKKNGGVPPVCPDERLRYVTAACGDCYECRRQKQRQWIVRMSEENRQTPNAYFLTLTIDDKSYKELKKKYKLKDNNDIILSDSAAISAMLVWRIITYYAYIVQGAIVIPKWIKKSLKK